MLGMFHSPRSTLTANLPNSKIMFDEIKGLLFQVNQMSADYLFQQDKPYDVRYPLK
jgi:hypothetical protein